jgi:hypothetical protein
VGEVKLDRDGLKKSKRKDTEYMNRIGLLPRPWSGHHPKNGTYSPLIKADIQKVSTSRKIGWRSIIFVDDCNMVTSHHPTKSSAENFAEGMLDVYTRTHYISK